MVCIYQNNLQQQTSLQNNESPSKPTSEYMRQNRIKFFPTRVKVFILNRFCEAESRELQDGNWTIFEDSKWSYNQTQTTDIQIYKAMINVWRM